MILRVEVTRYAYKQLDRAPQHVNIEFVQVQEVHPHDY
jgi:hypothetical protein